MVKKFRQKISRKFIINFQELPKFFFNVHFWKFFDLRPYGKLLTDKTIKMKFLNIIISYHSRALVMAKLTVSDPLRFRWARVTYSLYNYNYKLKIVTQFCLRLDIFYHYAIYERRYRREIAKNIRCMSRCTLLMRILWINSTLTCWGCVNMCQSSQCAGLYTVKNGNHQ